MKSISISCSQVEDSTRWLVGFMVFKVTFNNISDISWWSVLLVEETGGPGENHRPSASHWQTLSHNVVHLALGESRTHNISDDRHSWRSTFQCITSWCWEILPLAEQVSLPFWFHVLRYPFSQEQLYVVDPSWWHNCEHVPHFLHKFWTETKIWQ
jgi:hypothetical protein